MLFAFAALRCAVTGNTFGLLYDPLCAVAAFIEHK